VILHTQKAKAEHGIVTMDEPWFYYVTDHELIWLPIGGKIPDRERITVQSKT
jgi:hypothetical protein